jgi:hypothetical protein
MTFAFTIFIGQAICVKPAATATSCVPPDTKVMIPPPIPPPSFSANSFSPVV